MDAIRYVVRWFIRFIVLWLVDAIALIIAAGILPGMSIQVPDLGSYIVVAAAVAFTLGIVNLLLRPLILLLALPLGVLVTVIIGFFANAFALLITARLMPALQIDGLLAAFLGGLVLAAVTPWSRACWASMMRIPSTTGWWSGWPSATPSRALPSPAAGW